PAPPMPPSRPAYTATPKPAPDKSALDKLAAAAVKTKASGDPKVDPTKRFDLASIDKLISHEKAQQVGATGAKLDPNSSLGAKDRNSAKLSPTLQAALNGWLDARFKQCWTMPLSLPDGDAYVAQVRVNFDRGGNLVGAPQLLNPPPDARWQADVTSVMAAVHACDPLRIPAIYAPYYEAWKMQTIHFDPKQTTG
ncbi:MAG: hypothetical protein KGI57_07620, partial [Hyphomicrobiales bacterium]|nr:hypothetical protein [Hyphomicrobiales bacterium]